MQAQQVPPSKQIGVGLIGYVIGKVHTHAWLNLRQFYGDTIASSPSLEAICGRNEAAVGAFRSHYGFARSYLNWRDLVRDPRVTVLDDCAPPDLHAEPSITAAELGKSVLCEKPLGRTAAEAYQMYHALRQSGQVHMTAFNKRFVPSAQYARELVRSGRLGRITHVVGTFYNIESGEGFGDPNIPLLWMMRSEVAGHGAISDLGSHLVDLMRFIVGEISSVSGAVQTFVKERPLPEDRSKKGKVDVEDLIVGTLRFEGGAVGTISVSWLPVSTRDYLALEVYGTKGSFRFCFDRPAELEVYFHDETDTRANGFRTVICTSRLHPMAKHFYPDQGGSYGFEQSFVSEIAHFVTSVEEGKSVEPIGASFYDGYLACLINDELVASAADGKWHSVSPKPR